VVVNLLNNAAKYTPEGGHIRLTTTAEGADAVLRVRDNGMGIPKAMLDTVFDLFAQGERTLDRSEGGLGIGLTLARRIVELHGGRIVARSDGPGEGSEFEVRLPRLHAQALDRDPVGGKLAVSERGRSILLVEDNADAAQSMAVLLQMMGHAVRVEHDGPSALARAAAEPMDLVLLDIGLPGMNGYQVARALRELPRGPAFRIYALTGYGQEEDRRRSTEAGFDGHLVKPVLPADLLALIESSDAAV
jgi:CheY-like chemotaxis protein